MLKRLLRSKPRPHKPLYKERRSRPEFVILNGMWLVADIKQRDGNSMVADLYRNLSDKQADKAMERQVSLELA